MYLDADSEERLKLWHFRDDTESLIIDFDQLLNKCQNGEFSDFELIDGEKEQGFGTHSLFFKARRLKFQNDKCDLDTPIYKESWRPEVFEKCS